MNQLELLDRAIDIVRAAGEILREGWGAAAEIDLKGEVNLVTEYDRRAEALIVNALLEEFPSHHICSEEQGDVGLSDSPFTWLVDPLDGTTNFAHGFPVFSVSVALMHRGEELIGVVYDPTRKELFTAARDMGAFVNGAHVHVSATAKLDTSLLATGFAYDRRTAADNNIRNVANFIRRCQGLRRAGSAALDLAYVACGRLDGYWEAGLHPWDVAAGTLMVREAGGSVTDFGGNRQHASGRQILASNGRIHREMVEVLGTG